MKITILITFFLSAFCLQMQSQEAEKTYRMLSIVSGNDTIPWFQLRDVHYFAPKVFRNNKERQEYTKLVRDVKKAYPYAKIIAESIIETYEYMETLPDDNARQKHLEDVQKYMMDTYKPQMKKMTKAQGKILVKLVDRQCNASTYDIVKSLLGSFKAGMYNVFAGMFGNSLKTKYDPKGTDADIEAIVLQIEEGTVDFYYARNYHGTWY